ncbi:putative E3 ubiquitin-protein ligase RHY1A [Tasmannia lanceolata]|uniref:putative E3 ubiquitin-protein ligase RHY1A n=1 Tax=Tasmannia lanceolata TaxID=3420 RepID=UPI0040637F5E
MLPGVECARRRRFYQGGSTDSHNSAAKKGTRHSSFCLYTSKHESNLNSKSMQRSATSQSFHTEKLGDIAREAKERLDGRLRTLRKSEIKRHNSMDNMKSEDFHGQNFGSVLLGGLRKEVCASRKFSWAKLGWKALESDECSVCLERFKVGDLLVHLRCAHRFHSRCLLPWIKANAHCPYCRTQILS